MIRCPLFFGGHFMHQSTPLQKAHGNSRLVRLRRQSTKTGRVPLGSWSRLATRFDASKPATSVVLGSVPKAASQIPATMSAGASAS